LSWVSLTLRVTSTRHVQMIDKACDDHCFDWQSEYNAETRQQAIFFGKLQGTCPNWVNWKLLRNSESKNNNSTNEARRIHGAQLSQGTQRIQELQAIQGSPEIHGTPGIQGCLGYYRMYKAQ
jgi:hypothetical protein